MEETNWAAGRLLFWVSVALGYIKPIAVTCIALWLCLTLARSVTICHQFTYSHTHTPRALGEWEGRCVLEECVCASASANSLGEEACIYNWEGELYVKEVCFWRKWKDLSDGGTWAYVLWAVRQSMFVRWCCGSAVGMVIRKTSISVILFILKEPKSFINYTQTALPLNGRNFSAGIRSSS